MEMRDHRASADLVKNALSASERAAVEDEEDSQDALDAGLGDSARAIAASVAEDWSVDVLRTVRLAYTSGEAMGQMHERARAAAGDWAEAYRRIAAQHAANPPSVSKLALNPDNATFFSGAVDLLSWAVCLDERETASALLTSPLLANVDDAVVDGLAVLGAVRPERGTDQLLYADLWAGWLAVLDASDAERPEALASYVRGWMEARVRVGLANDPSATSFLGEWCFDAAALAVALEIDDTACREVPEYPADLVDHARSLRA